MGSSVAPKPPIRPGPYGQMDQPAVTQQAQPLAQNDQTMTYAPYSSLGTPTNGAPQPGDTGIQGGGLMDQQDVLARIREGRQGMGGGGSPTPFFG